MKQDFILVVSMINLQNFFGEYITKERLMEVAFKIPVAIITEEQAGKQK